MGDKTVEDLYDLRAFVQPLCQWYQDNKRSMPWREEPTPYHVWISEIMLQQTRIEAVKAYYSRFIEKLPDVKALADVPEEELLKLWEGLGYYNRAKNLKKAAVLMVERYEGKLPADYDLLLSLPGIGSYTAGAVASIAYGLPAPAVDGNVMRVLMRCLDCYEDIMRQTVRRKVERSVMAVVPKDCPGEFNQGIMELGETICIPNGVPLCGECPLKSLCAGHLAGHERELPVKKGKKERRIEERTVLLFERDGRIALAKRKEKGLLAGMWEFPSVEGKRGPEEIKEWLSEQEIETLQVKGFGRTKHIFSHIEWHMSGYLVVVPPDFPEDSIPGTVWAEREELSEKYAIPTAFRYFRDKLSG